MAIGDLYALSFFINSAGEQTQCTLGYAQDGGSNDADTLEALCQAFLDTCVPTLKLAIAADVSVNRIKVDTVTDHQEVPGLMDLNGEDGLVAGTSLAAQFSALIHLPTNAPNAKHNGRIYVAGIEEQSQQEGTINALSLDLYQDFADTLALDLEPTVPQDATFTPVVISRVEDGVPRGIPFGFPVLVPVAKASIRQQRRRKVREFGFR